MTPTGDPGSVPTVARSDPTAHVAVEGRQTRRVYRRRRRVAEHDDR
jgi:hypothetical protein